MHLQFPRAALLLALALQVTTSSASPSASIQIEIGDDLRARVGKIGNVMCPQKVADRLYDVVHGNDRQIYAMCIQDGDFSFFMVTSEKPTSAQIAAVVSSPACIALASGVVLAKLPECDFGGLSVRSRAEILLRIKTALADDKPSASTLAAFGDLYAVNRAANLLNEKSKAAEAAIPDAATRIAITDLVKTLPSIDVSADIKLDDDLSILMREGSEWRLASAVLGEKNNTGGTSTVRGAAASSSNSTETPEVNGTTGGVETTASSGTGKQDAVTEAPKQITTPTTVPAPTPEMKPSGSYTATRTLWAHAVSGAVALAVSVYLHM